MASTTQMGPRRENGRPRGDRVETPATFRSLSGSAPRPPRPSPLPFAAEIGGDVSEETWIVKTDVRKPWGVARHLLDGYGHPSCGVGRGQYREIGPAEPADLGYLRTAVPLKKVAGRLYSSAEAAEVEP